MGPERSHDRTAVVPLAFPDKWYQEQQWYVERWQAEMALAMRDLFTTEHAVSCLAMNGHRQWKGYAGGDAYTVYLQPVASGPGVSFRPEIMVRVWDRRASSKKGRGGGAWPLGLILFESEEAAK